MAVSLFLHIWLVVITLTSGIRDSPPDRLHDAVLADGAVGARVATTAFLRPLGVAVDRATAANVATDIGTTDSDVAGRMAVTCPRGRKCCSVC